MILKKPRGYKWPRRMASYQGVTHWLWLAGAKTAYAAQAKIDSRHTFSRSNSSVLRVSTRAKVQRRYWILNKVERVPDVPSQFQLFYGDSYRSVRTQRHEFVKQLNLFPVGSPYDHA